MIGFCGLVRHGQIVNRKAGRVDAESPYWPQRRDRHLGSGRSPYDAGDAAMGDLLSMEPQDELASSDVD